MICHRTSEYRTHELGYVTKYLPHELRLSTNKNAQYLGLYTDGNMQDGPIDGAGVIDVTTATRCADCGWTLDAQVCRHCGRQG